ncbi:class I SAM-dependent methyltransferase [Catenuloplanes atrovinosus]|uniref:Phospholipid N-methyltransferase n=1 Tax=Catenuloplanes atrovinosus TaxID=137266 RepID=A0AAE3YSJ8_9ACTN|nr:methyltransferase domain-containing protein [Catenuloplanes atrovinosus]MDR7279109.1 phospholipid N-methyltransferase [Catenuloplanes atrovinosus]
MQRFLRNPARVGTPAATSAAVSRQMAAPIPEHGDPLVVELGAGTGAVTEWIQHRLGGRGHHLAIEIDPVFAGLLRTRWPGLDVAEADAAQLPALLAERGLGAADVIVSALPWTLFSEEQARDILTAVAASLAPHGAFTTITLSLGRRMPSARRFRDSLASTFEEVTESRTFWRNPPPAFVYEAHRPRQRRPSAGS